MEQPIALVTMAKMNPTTGPYSTMAAIQNTPESGIGRTEWMSMLPKEKDSTVVGLLESQEMPYGPSTWLSGSNSANEPVRLAKPRPMRVG